MADEEVTVAAPLFDRLVDLEPRSRREARPFRALDRRGLRESVRRELERLLNTRSSLPASRLAERELTVIDYGVPDFVDQTPKNPTDRARIAKILERTIAAFEPRLREVRVEIGDLRDEKQALWVKVDALLVVDEVREPISFPAVIRRGAGESEVDAAS